jgi:flagellar biosynthesis protein FlhB
MPENEHDQRTEQATPRKLEKLREEGTVLSSHDVISAVVLAAVAATLAMMGGGLCIQLIRFSQRVFRLQQWTRPFDSLAAAVSTLNTAAAPLLVAALAAIVAGAAQTRIFSIELASFKPERLNPLPQLKQIFPSKQSMIEIGKQLLKLVVIGFIVYKLVEKAVPRFALLAATEVSVGAAAVASVAAKLAVYGGIALVLLSMVDYWISYRRFSEQAKMSFQDIKDELKEEEGNPQVRQRIRQRFREMLRRRGVSAVKQATVLVTNPTHLAIALRYKPEVDVAPLILFKGREHLAMQMRATARKHGVPIVEHRPLARSLYDKGKEGRTIPVELYRAVAEVIVHVMKLRAGGTIRQEVAHPRSNGGGNP